MMSASGVDYRPVIIRWLSKSWRVPSKSTGEIDSLDLLARCSICSAPQMGLHHHDLNAFEAIIK